MPRDSGSPNAPASALNHFLSWPDACKKCGATVLVERERDRTSTCFMCGWVGYVRPPRPPIDPALLSPAVHRSAGLTTWARRRQRAG